MEAITILKNRKGVNWDYNEETDTFYLSIGRTQTAAGIEIGEGLVAHYDEINKEVIGLSLTGLRAKVLKQLGKDIVSDAEDNRLANAERKVSEDDKESAAYGKQQYDKGGEA